MNFLISNGIVGIITGILTTAILYALKVFWTSKAKPFFQSMKYQGVDIKGIWKGSAKNSNEDDGDNFEFNCELVLRQNAHSLSGSFLFKFKNDIKDFELTFNVIGYIWEGYITLNFTPKDKRITSYATSMLKLHDGGYSLIGAWLFRDVQNEFVNNVPLMLIRDVE